MGEAHEHVLDVFFGRWYRVVPVTMEMQKMGVDRVFYRLGDGSRFSVEYKSDDTAARTGNAFIELVSVNTTGKPGWALSSLAQVLVYYIPPARMAHCLRMLDLKMDADSLASAYPRRQIPNNGYYTEGVIVPLKTIVDRYAIKSLEVTR